MRISSIDIGSNAIRQIIVEVNTDSFARNQWIIHKKFRVPLRLGSDVFKYGSIQPETAQELVATFKKMAKLNKKYRVQKNMAVATSAMRDAKNNTAIVRFIQKQTGIKINVISGSTEAKYLQQSIIKSNLVNFKSSLLIDIGGGSLELTAIHNLAVHKSKSFPLGVVRLLSKIQRSQASTSHQIRFAIEKEMNKYIGPFYNKIVYRSFSNAIGTGGNFDALSKLKIDLLRTAPATNLSLKEVEAIYSKWLRLSLNQRLKLNIRKDRIDVLDIAIPLIILILKKFKIKKLKVPHTGLKEGVIHSLL